MMIQKKQERFVFLDAWRGIAAMGVLLTHIIGDSVMSIPLGRILPDFIKRLSEFGAYGVQIFFVLSGFVIAHSLRNIEINSQSVWNFILRRQIRLDFPYWVVLIFTLALSRIEAMVPSLKSPPSPALDVIALNFFYLHKLADVSSISPVSWTLCIEIQFYLVFIFILALSSWILRLSQRQNLLSIAAPLVFGLGTVSLVWIHISTYSVIFLFYWFYFALGALCYWSIQRLISPLYFYGFIAIFLLSQTKRYFADFDERNISFEAMSIALVFSLLIYVVGRRGDLTRLWNNKFMQYMGRNSYSLYLTHVPVLMIVLRAAYKITGENEIMAVVWLVIATLSCVGVAHLLHIAVEKPSMYLASRLKNRKDSSEPPRIQVPGLGEAIPASGNSTAD